MTPGKRQRRPSFIWQAMLILLPVVSLAVVGGVSLRVEQKASEDEVRTRARESVTALSRVLGEGLTKELTRYSRLQSQWSSELRTDTVPGTRRVGPPSSDLDEEFQNWDRDFAILAGGGLHAILHA